MYHSTSLFRRTKTRTARAQDQLHSSLLQYKPQSYSQASAETSYHQTYGVPLPETSVQILKPIIDALTDNKQIIDVQTRLLFTLGIWRESSERIYRCCFIQPEIATATCSFPIAYKPEATEALNSICAELPEASACVLLPSKTRLQISGRMAPYVAELLRFNTSWGFANVSKSYFLFLSTDTRGQALLKISKGCMDILKDYFPEYSACVFDAMTNSYKITVRPDPTSNMNEPNKNTCMYVYSDGSFRLQGKPSKMARVCESFREAIFQIASSHAWNSFTSRFISDKNQASDQLF